MRSKTSVIWVLLLICLLAGCKSKDKNALYAEGLEYRDAGNSQGAIVLFKNVLERDPNFFEARLALAQSYLELERLEVAEKEFQKVLLQDPDNLDALIGLNEIQLRSDRSQLSTEQLLAVLEKNPDEPRLLNLLGEAYARQRQFDQAEDIFARVLKIDAGNESATLNLARVKIVGKNSAAAYRLLDEYLKTNPKSVAARTLFAHLLVAEGRQAEALTEFFEVFRLDPDQGGVLYRAGLLALDLEDLASADAALAKLQQQYPNNPATTRLEGLIQFQRNDFEKAVVALQASLGVREDLLAYYFLGLAQYRIGQFEQSISQFQKGLDLEPAQVPLRVSLAQALLKTGRLDDCIAELRKALHYDENSALAYSALGSAYLEQGEFEQAMEMLDRAAELDPGIADVHRSKGIFNLQRGNVQQAEVELETALQLAPEVLNTRIILASHYLQQQNFAAAVRLLNEGLQGEAADALLYNYLAGAYFAQQDTARALEALHQAIQLAPDYLTPTMNLAGYHVGEGDYDRAIEVYREALRHQPGNPRLLVSLASVLQLRGDEAQVLEVLRQAAAGGDVLGVAGLVRYRLLQKDLPGALEVLEDPQLKADAEPKLLELKVAVQLALGQQDAAFASLLQWARIAPESGASALLDYYLQKGDQTAALGLVDKLILENPNSGLGHWLKARFYASTGQPDVALQAIEVGLRREPRNPQLKLMQATLYQRMGQSTTATELLNRLISEQPGFFPAIFSLAVLHDSSGDKSQARRLYEKTLNINRQYLPALNNLAYLLAENYGDRKGALELAIRAYRQLPSSAEVMDTLGFVLLKDGRFEDAIPLLEKAQAALPDHPTVQLHLGMAYQGAGQHEKAKYSLEQVLVAGNRDEALEARRILRNSH